MVELDNPVEASVEAALELEELRQGRRSDAPSLHALFEMLLKPTPAFLGNGVRMFADVQNYYLSASAKPAKAARAPSREEIRRSVEAFLSDLEDGVTRRDSDKIAEAKKLCLAINNNLLARKMDDIFSRREKSDTRYVKNESSAKF
jgi:hypothetical protein